MSGFGTALGRALGGLGAGAAALANRYIDEEIQQQRAQALSDIQFANTKRNEEYSQSEAVQGPRLLNQRRELSMRNEEGLKGRVAEASSPELRQAKIDDRVGYLRGTTPAEIEAANARTAGTAGAELDKERMRRKVLDPMDVAKAGAISEGQWSARDAHDQRLDGKGVKSAFDRLPEAKKLEVQQIAAELKDINKAVIEAQASGGWDEAKNPGQKQLSVAKAALQQRLRGILDGDANDDPLGIFEPKPKPGAAAQPRAGGPAAQAAPATPAAPQEPGLMAKAAKWFSETGRDYSTPEGKQELRQRIAEANAGGDPLTRTEQMRAQQLGLM